MSNETQDNLCREVEERIAEVIRGEAEPRLYEHIASCDACRDLRLPIGKSISFRKSRQAPGHVAGAA